jgi:hypothetical protein
MLSTGIDLEYDPDHKDAEFLDLWLNVSGTSGAQ